MKSTNFFKISLSALILDLGLFIYSYFFLNDALSGEKKLTEILNIFQSYSMVFLMQFFLPVYIGLIASQYIDFINRKKHFYTKLFGIFEGFVAFTLFFAGFFVIDRFKLTGNAMSILIYVFGSLFSLTFGVLISMRYYNPKIKEAISDEEDKDKSSSICKILAPFLVILNIIITILLKVFDNIKIGWGLVILYLFISIFAIMGIMMGLGIVVYNFKKWFKTIAIYKGIENFIFSIIIITLINFWIEIIINWVLPSSYSNPGFTQILIILGASGYLLLRIFIELKPPFTPINIITGFISLFYFVYQLIMYKKI